MVLSMCFAGAKHNTARELKKFLGFDKFPDIKDMLQEMTNFLDKISTFKYLSIKTASCIITRNGFDLDERYENIIKNSFKSNIKQKDFKESRKVVEEINEWVALQTNNKIENIVKHIDPLTQIFVINAIYFKGDWLNKFESERSMNFFMMNGAIKKCKMMSLDNAFLSLLNEPFALHITTCTIPYKSNEASMTIILPNKGYDINTIEAEIQAHEYGNVLEYLIVEQRRVEKERVNVLLPSFKFTFNEEVFTF